MTILISGMTGEGMYAGPVAGDQQGMYAGPVAAGNQQVQTSQRRQDGPGFQGPGSELFALGLKYYPF